MKRIIYILTFLILSQSVYSQIEQDKLNHAWMGVMIGYSSTALTYQITERKSVSMLAGFAVSMLAGHLKEKYDSNHGGIYNKQDLKATGIGGFTGSLTIRLILIPTVNRRDIPLDAVFVDENAMIAEKYYLKSRKYKRHKARLAWK